MISQRSFQKDTVNQQHTFELVSITMNFKTGNPTRPLKRRALVARCVLMILFLMENSCYGLGIDDEMPSNNSHVGNLRKKSVQPSSSSSSSSSSHTSVSSSEESISSKFEESTYPTQLRRKSISNRLRKLLQENEIEEGTVGITQEVNRNTNVLSIDEENSSALSSPTTMEISADGWTRALKHNKPTESAGIGSELQGWADSKRDKYDKAHQSILPPLFSDASDKRGNASEEPTMVPSEAPTSRPSTRPTNAPSNAPSISVEPTSSQYPSASPSKSISPSESAMPSDAPSLIPSEVPSTMPSSNAPSFAPTTDVQKVVSERDKLRTQIKINEKEAQLTKVYNNIKRNGNGGSSSGEQRNPVRERENLIRRGVVLNNLRQEGYSMEDVIRDRKYSLYVEKDFH